MAVSKGRKPLDSKALLRVLEVTRKLAVPSELVDILAQIIDAGRVVLSADRGSVFLYDAATQELYTMVATGISGIRFPVTKGIAGECAQTRKLINIPDAYADPRFNQEIDRRTGYRTTSLITVPLIGLDDQLVGVLQLLNPDKGVFDEGDENLAEILASQAAVAIQRTRLLEERVVKAKLERDIALAREIQQRILPRKLPTCPGYSIAAYNKPADDTGGDIYDLIADPNGHPAAPILLVVADATGHGIGPALSVSQFRAMVRVGFGLTAGLNPLVQLINRQLSQDLPDNRFVTAFIGLLDPESHKLNYQAAGQGPLLHYHAATGRCDWLEATFLPLAIDPDMPLDHVPPIHMEIGDFFMILTDGFYEYQNRSGEQYSKERVGELVQARRNLPADQFLEALLEDVRGFADGGVQLDDLTAIIVKRTD